ncbi:MAG: response regulator transcription factor [Ruminococcaceae bacterium]|nr:response regulator transcription factor [Oscillospiraceae bacterium]
MAKNRFKILIVEDDSNIRTFVRTMLEAEDYQVLCAADCKSGLSLFSSHCPDLVILDLGLPDLDGTEFITYARGISSVPILVLSARTTDDDKVAALDMGANDYITKPFSAAEFLARVRSALRNRRYDDQDGVLGETFDVADLHIDFARRLVTLSGREVRLTQTEYNIVTVLAHHAGRVMTYASIIRAVWGSTDEGSVKKLQVNLANIRKKLGERPGDRRYISNELGVGYRMISDDD